MGKVEDGDFAVAKSKITRPDISMVIPLIMQLFKACKRLVSIAKNNPVLAATSPQLKTIENISSKLTSGMWSYH